MLQKFRFMCIEVHFIGSLLKTYDNPRNKLRYTLDRLQKMFDIVHIAPNNNCPYLEKTDRGQVIFYDCMDITFLNRAMRKHDPIKVTKFPHILDAKHVEHKPAVDSRFLKGILLNLKNSQNWVIFVLILKQC